MQRADERHRIPPLNHVVFPTYQLPVCVVDEHEDPRAAACSLQTTTREEVLRPLTEVRLLQVEDELTEGCPLLHPRFPPLLSPEEQLQTSPDLNLDLHLHSTTPLLSNASFLLEGYHHRPADPDPSAAVWDSSEVGEHRGGVSAPEVAHWAEQLSVATEQGATVGTEKTDVTATELEGEGTGTAASDQECGQHPTERNGVSPV